MTELRYVTGDATNPVGEGRKIIIHCCNNLGVWGAGFVLALSHKWARPEEAYKQWAAQVGPAAFRALLGALQIVPVEPDLSVGNLIGQEGVGRDQYGNAPIRYEAIQVGLKLLAQYHTTKGPLSVHGPRFGAGLAGGSWSRVEALIQEELVDKGIPVTIYDLP